MSKRNLFNPEIAQSETDDLYNGTLIFRKTRPVALTGTGIIKRGTPITTVDGIAFIVWSPTVTVDTEEVTAPIIGILLLDIDTDETEEAQNAVLGITGEFNQNKIEEALSEANGIASTLTQDAIQEAWGRQIHIEASYKYPDVETFPLG